MTNRLVRFLKYSLCAGLLAGSACAADPEWLGLVPASNTFVGLNLERLRASRLGQTVFSKLEEWAKEADDVTGRTEIEMLRGTREIFLAGPVFGRTTRFLVLLSGSFKLADLQTLASANGMSSAVVGNVTLFSDKAALSVALMDSSLIVAGDPQTVRDCVAGRGPAVRLDPAMAAKIGTLRSSRDYWQLSTGSLEPLAVLTMGTPSGELLRLDLLKSVHEISGGITFGPRTLVAIEMVTGDQRDAIALVKALRMSHLGDAVPGLSPELMASLARSLDLRAEGNTVKIGLEIPEAELVKLFLSSTEARRTPPNTDVVIQAAPLDSGASPSSGDTGVVTLPGP